MIVWKDGSQPAMRRPVRGHWVVFQSIMAVDGGQRLSRELGAYCARCGVSWTRTVSLWTARRIADGNRRALADVIDAATRTGPSCEEAFRIILSLEVMGS
jgi:hypothetical protein